MAMSHDRGPAEQQGDGQPENLNELRDPAGGSALAGEEKSAPSRASGASTERSGAGTAERGDPERQPRGGSQADGDEVLDTD